MSDIEKAIIEISTSILNNFKSPKCSLKEYLSRVAKKIKQEDCVEFLKHFEVYQRRDENREDEDYDIKVIVGFFLKFPIYKDTSIFVFASEVVEFIGENVKKILENNCKNGVYDIPRVVDSFAAYTLSGTGFDDKPKIKVCSSMKEFIKTRVKYACKKYNILIVNDDPDEWDDIHADHFSKASVSQLKRDTSISSNFSKASVSQLKRDTSISSNFSDKQEVVLKELFPILNEDFDYDESELEYLKKIRLSFPVIEIEEDSE